MEGPGQELYAHACDVCFHVVQGDNGELRKIQAAVCDGNTIGHPCCAVHDSKIPLARRSHWYCLEHTSHEDICAIKGCDLAVEHGHRTCGLEDHRRAESHYFEKGQALFQLSARLKKAGVTSTTDAMGGVNDEEYDNLAKLENDNEEDLDCDGKPEITRQSVKAAFGRRYTHAELLIMRPCGVILSRATMYGSEAISGVHFAAKATFPTQNSTPEFFFYDSNCKLIAHQRSIHDHHFDQTARPVDVFHFKTKHTVTDLHCQQNCNPAAFPELIVNGKWRFNTSICEQTNVWFGSYHAIVQNMDPVQYNFYLDEMIKRRNCYIVQELNRKGKSPWIIDISDIIPVTQ
ncbi:hypothetical protein PTI98_013495 [Pleurotus ostreatus]|nr:hypothetical protein PTI98_013495 [Pleurotus ostreatus]